MGFQRQVFRKKEDAQRERRSAGHKEKKEHYKRSEFKKTNYLKYE